MDSDAIELMEYNSLMWPASLHHLMYFFEPNHEKKNILLASSINRFDFLMKERFTRDHIRRFFVDKPNLEIQRHYKLVLSAFCIFSKPIIIVSLQDFYWRPTARITDV